MVFGIYSKKKKKNGQFTVRTNITVNVQHSNEFDIYYP